MELNKKTYGGYTMKKLEMKESLVRRATYAEKSMKDSKKNDLFLNRYYESYATIISIQKEFGFITPEQYTSRLDEAIHFLVYGE